MANAVPKSIKASLYIDGKPAEASLKNIEQQTRSLERELKGLVPGTEAFSKKLEQLAGNKKYLKDIKDEVNGVSGAFGRLKQELGKVGTLAAGYLGFQFITSQFQGIISGNAKLSDSLADLRRVAGLTEAGVLNLDASLGKLDTRTSKSGLREIAVIAGKLGVAKGQILGFVEATDKLVVALGDELGNADQITTTLGKILNVFDGEVTGDNITRLGNAMVKLANDGVASAGFISDFTQRVSGIAKTAGLSLPATLAFGAGIEELGGRSESAATAMQKLLLSIASDTPKAAKIAGVSVKEFTKLLGDAPEQALLKYTRGLVANKTAFSDVTKALDDAGEEGARTIETITKLGQNTEFFSLKIRDASTAILGYNEINEAFNLKNQTLGAQVDKLGKDFNSLSQNKALVNFLTGLVVLASDSVTWIKKNSEAIAMMIKGIVVVTAGWVGYRTAVILAGTWTAAMSGFMAASRTISLLLALAQATLAGNTIKAAAAQRLLGLTMAANPLGAVLAVVSALAAAYVLYSSKITTAAQIQGDLNAVKVEAAKNALQEKTFISILIQQINAENVTRANKLIAVQKLREIMPAYLKQYSDEEILAGKATGAIQKYIGALEQRTAAEAAQSKIVELQKRNIELERNENLRAPTVLENLGAGAINLVGGNGAKFIAKRLNNDKQDELAANRSRIKELISTYGGAIATNALAGDETPPGGTTPLGTPDKKAESAAESTRKKAIADFEKLDDEYKKLELQRLNDQLSANEKEVKQEADKYDALIQKEKDFLKQKGVTPDQKKTTEGKIVALSTDRDKAVTDLRVRQETEMTQKIQELRTRLANLHESELTKQKDQINKFYDDLESQNAGNLDRIASLRIERTKELGNADLRESERLAKDKAEIESKYDQLAHGDTKKTRLATINKQYDDEITALKLKFSKELIATKSFQDAIDAIEKNRNVAIKAESVATDEAKKQSHLETAQQAADGAFTIMANNRSAETNHLISSFEKQRTSELANKNLTDQQKDLINAKYDEKIRQAKIKAWKADQVAAIAQVVINGAIAVSKALAQTGILAPFVIPAIVAGAAIQAGVILAQPQPEFAGGGFSNDDPAGYVGQPTIFKKSASGRSFMAGEAGKEWIAPNWMVQSPRFANVIGMLESARQEKRAYAMGGFNGGSNSSNPLQPQLNDQNQNFEKLEGLVIAFIQEQQRFNRLPIVNDYAVKEDYERKLQNDRAAQMG